MSFLTLDLSTKFLKQFKTWTYGGATLLCNLIHLVLKLLKVRIVSISLLVVLVDTRDMLLFMLSHIQLNLPYPLLVLVQLHIKLLVLAFLLLQNEIELRFARI